MGAIREELDVVLEPYLLSLMENGKNQDTCVVPVGDAREVQCDFREEIQLGRDGGVWTNRLWG